MRIGIALVIALAAARSLAQQPCPPDTGPLGAKAPIVLFASLPPGSSESPQLHAVRGSVLQDYVARFTRPSDITLVRAKAEAVLESAGVDGAVRRTPFAEVSFTYGTDGRYTQLQRPVSTGDPRFDSALVEPVARLQAERVAYFLPGGLDTLQVRILIVFDAAPDTYLMPIAQLAPRSTITRSAHIVHTDIYPVWPKEMEEKRINDDVVVRILVDEHGRAVMDSVKVVEGKHKEYIDAVLAVIPKYRWTPALAGGCTVKQWVQMPFMFHFAGVK
jgi:hypothetical protein